MKIVAIANQKGGVGKTTTAINLSAALAAKGQRVLLIDLDPQANATSGIGHEPDGSESMYFPLLGESTMEEKIIPSRLPNLSLIPSGMDLAGVEIELARMDDHLMRLRGLLASSKQHNRFDFCILDTPPSLGVLMTSALAAADEILIPLQCEWFGLEGLAKIVQVIDQIRDTGANPDVILEGILIYTHMPLVKEIDIKVFVDADSDDRLGRVIERDMMERGRDVKKVLDRYHATVKPMHLQFIEPSKRYADIIVPQGGMNEVAISILLNTIEKKLKL
jgi:chromosome partitioning protein